MGEAEDRRHGGAPPRLRFDREASPRHLGAHLEERHPQPHPAGGAGGEERVGDRRTCSGVMPQPSSLTVIVRVSAAGCSSTVISMSEAPARTEFCAMSSTFSESSCMALLVFGEDGVDVVDRQAAVDLVVDHQDRRKAAGAHAAAGVEAEFPVRACTCRTGCPSFSWSIWKISPEPLT